MEAFTSSTSQVPAADSCRHSSSCSSSWKTNNAKTQYPLHVCRVAASPPLDQITAEEPRQNLTDTLLSYRSNIRRMSEEHAPKDQAQAKKPIWSLIHFLEQQQQQKTTAGDMSSCTPQLITETILPGLHAAAKYKDYRLLLRLWDSTVVYCQGTSTQAALPRLLSETLTCLGKTAASYSKIKRTWTQATMDVPNLTPRETNAYLKLFVDTRPGAAVRLWQTERVKGRTDAYSLALVLRALENSVRQQGVLQDEEINVQDDEEVVDDDAVALPLDKWKTNSWQWNQAVQILSNDILYPPTGSQGEETESSEWTNPVVVTALLQLNHQVAKLDRRHPEAALAWAIYKLFVVNDNRSDLAPHLHVVQADIQLCTALLTCLRSDAPRAVELWRAMQQPKDNNLTLPNVYALGAVLAACARAGKYSAAWKILDQQEHGVIPNTVVYNTMLSALTTTTRSSNIHHRGHRPTRLQRQQAQERYDLAQSILERMQTSPNSDEKPDTVTYNTLLQIVAAVDEWPNEWFDKHATELGYESTNWPVEERLVHTLLDQMEKSRIPRNVLTFCSAVGSVRSFQGVIQMVGRALKDETLQGDATEIFDAALRTLSREGDLDGIQLVIAKMIREGISPTRDSLSSVIRGLANGGHTRSIPFLILALMGNQDATDHLFAVHKLDLQVNKLPPLVEEHLTAAITSCLSQNDFENARRILLHMRDRGMEPSDECLEETARSYAHLALNHVHGKHVPTEAMSRAQSAFDIVRRLDEPPLGLQASVARACAAVGVFANAHKVLKSIHDEFLASQPFRVLGHSACLGEMELISGLHRSILKSTAEQGNVTFALVYAEEIQSFSRECTWGVPAVISVGDNWSDGDSEVGPLRPTMLNDETRSDPRQPAIGMTAAEWNYVLEAAAKSGHWKVCINTLQFLRPYLVALHPDRINGKEEASRANAEYKMLSRGIVSATKCFYMRPQYGWAVRAIEDWILWSGRRPPKDAVQASIRILSARGRSDEVYRLVANCLQQPVQDPVREGKAYEVLLFVHAITALYKNGLYDAADDMFIAAVSSRVIPFQLEQQLYGAEKRMTLDLHGMNSAVAHSAVRCALQQKVLSSSWNQTALWDNDLVIVTGRGKRSSLRLRPILRPEVQRMLMEEFFPPLGTVSLPGNTGALRVPSDAINEWVYHQRQQKGVRMLAVAALLKNITSGSRLRQAFAKAAMMKAPDGTTEL